MRQRSYQAPRETTLFPLPAPLDAEVRAVVRDAVEAVNRGQRGAPPVDVAEPFMVFNGYLADGGEVYRAPTVLDRIRDPGGMLDGWLAQQTPMSVPSYLASDQWYGFTTVEDQVMRNLGHAPSYPATPEFILLGVSPDHDDLVLNRTYLYPVGHLCTGPGNSGMEPGACPWPGHPHLIRPSDRQHRMPLIEQVDPAVADLVRACQTGQSIAAAVGPLDPAARDRLYRQIVHLVTVRVAYLSVTPPPEPPPTTTGRSRWFRRRTEELPPTPVGVSAPN